MTGHDDRVLHLAGSPDGQQIVTGAADQTLRFWNVFPPNSSVKRQQTQSILLQNMIVR